MDKRLITALLVPLTLILLASFAYAQWTDSVFINATATTGDIEIKVTYAWLESPFPQNLVTVTWTDDAASFAVGGYIYPGFTLNTGTDLKNVGSLPAKIETIAYSYTPTIIQSYFTITNDFAFSPDGSTWKGTTLPVTLLPGQYLKIHQSIKFNVDAPNEAQALSITITATVTAIQAVP
jgi:hypothetical protein